MDQRCRHRVILLIITIVCSKAIYFRLSNVKVVVVFPLNIVSWENKNIKRYKKKQIITNSFLLDDVSLLALQNIIFKINFILYIYFNNLLYNWRTLFLRYARENTVLQIIAKMPANNLFMLIFTAYTTNYCSRHLVGNHYQQLNIVWLIFLFTPPVYNIKLSANYCCLQTFTLVPRINKIKTPSWKFLKLFFTIFVCKSLHLNNLQFNFVPTSDIFETFWINF